MSECKECKKSFSNNSNLRKHIKKFHEANLSELPYKIKFVNKRFKCEECGNNFNKEKHLWFHKNKKHGRVAANTIVTNNSGPSVKRTCPLCPFQARSTADYKGHFANHHNIQLEEEAFDFESKESFETWKTCLEKDTNARYVKKERFNAKFYKGLKYSCNRSGYYISQKQEMRQRHLKTQGSSKINGYCPASLMVKFYLNGTVSVKFLKTHVGHQCDIGHLYLTLAERQSIAEKIASKVPFSAILDEVRDSIQNEKLERVHLLSKKDLYNIENAYNLNSLSVRHKDDAVSVEVWASEMKDAGSVLFYKAQETTDDLYPFLTSKDFVLIIMTDAQAEIMSKYGSDCVCVDGTHGMNGYGFELNTVLVLDSLRQGFPCAFLISNRSDHEVLSLFFSCIKEKVGIIAPKVFMSDLAESFFNSWIQVMAPPEHRLYCTWHLDRAWRNNLSKIKEKEKQVLVYRQLRTLLEETDISAFSVMIEGFQQQLQSDHDLHSFLQYFVTYYVNKAPMWAYCFRMHTGLNTNMHIERMHKTLKYIYLNGKNVTRLDKAISAIMKFVRDKLFDSLIVAHKGKICSKIKDLRKRHKVSLDLDISLVVPGEGGWNVASSNKCNMYTVEEYNNNCNCQITCMECKACIHTYRCSCIDSAIKWNMCKHIHLVSRYRASNQSSSEPQTQSDHEENNLHIHVDKPSFIEENCILKELSKNDNLNITYEHKKNEIKTKFLQMLESTTSLEELKIVDNAIAPIAPTLAVLRSQKHVNYSTSEGNNTIVPHNKKINMQRRLFSTKKKKTTKNIISKPSASEIDKVAANLLLSKM